MPQRRVSDRDFSVEPPRRRPAVGAAQYFKPLEKQAYGEINAYELDVNVTAPPSVQTRLGCVPALWKKNGTKIRLLCGGRFVSSVALTVASERQEQETVCATT